MTRERLFRYVRYVRMCEWVSLACATLLLLGVYQVLLMRGMSLLLMYVLVVPMFLLLLWWQQRTVAPLLQLSSVQLELLLVTVQQEFLVIDVHSYGSFVEMMADLLGFEYPSEEYTALADDISYMIGTGFLVEQEDSRLTVPKVVLKHVHTLY